MVEAEPLSLAELGGGRERGLAAVTLEAQAAGGRIEARGLGFELPPLPAALLRELPIRLRLRGEEGFPPRLAVTWYGEDGEPHSLTVDGRRQPGAPVRAWVEGPFPVARDERGVVYEGRLRLEVPLAALTRPGRLAGRLEIRREP
ncbi:MAG: hypothetical protein RML12_03990 [Xanthomonadales bacterium]|nr:hypothetical protein [Xanthomonadales bacterium]